METRINQKQHGGEARRQLCLLVMCMARVSLQQRGDLEEGSAGARRRNGHGVMITLERWHGTQSARGKALMRRWRRAAASPGVARISTFAARRRRRCLYSTWRKAGRWRRDALSFAVGKGAGAALTPVA